MAQFNELNRPEAHRNIGTISATGTFMLQHAAKDMKIRSVRLVALAAIVGTSTNNLSFQLKKMSSSGTETNQGTAVTSESGVAKGATLVLTSTPFDLDAGESLIVTATKAGTGAWANCFAVIDYEIIGN